MTHAWAFNFDMLVGYLYGGFTFWAFARNRWWTLTSVSVIFLFGLAADVQRDFL